MKSSNLDFEALFKATPNLYLVLTPEYIIIEANDAYLTVTKTKRKDILGKHLFEVFPEDPNDPHATGIQNLRASLEYVCASLKAHNMPIQKYDLPTHGPEGISFEERYWSPMNTPMLSPNGELQYIIHRIEDVTEFMQLKHQKTELTTELETNREKMEAEIYNREKEIEQTKEALISSHERYTTLTSMLPVGVFHANQEGFCSYVNPCWQEMTKINSRDIQNKLWYEHISKEDQERIAGEWLQHTGSSVFKTEFRILLPDEQLKWVLAQVSPQIDKRGEITSYVGSFTDITERKQKEEAERKRSEMLMEVDRAKTLFFSNVSHEFRTPLTLILSPLEDILADKKFPLLPEQHYRFELIQRNSLRLLKLVNSLLDFARIEANRMEAIYEPIDIVQLTTNLASSFRSTIEKAGLQLIVEGESFDECVYLDKEMWEKIIFNLLSNAFKFTLQGSIRVILKKQEDHVEVVIQDTGVGISEAELPRLFERFHRIENSKGRSYEGSGIGLALTQELIKLHRGTIQVTSKEGEGACFIVSIPLGSAHLPAEKLGKTRDDDQMASMRDTFIAEAERWLSTEEKLPVENISEELSPSNAQGYQSIKILLADDNADMRNYMKNLLEKRWFVEAVADGEAALQSALTEPPDLIISDVMMPKLDGLQLLEALRSNSKTETIPVLLCSARAGEEERLKGLQIGADGYLVKPFTAKELMAQVTAQLKIAQIRKAAFKREQELLIATEVAQNNLTQVLTNLKDGFFILDRQWQFTYVNQPIFEMFEKSKEELLGHVFFDLYPDVKGTTLESDLRAAIEHGQLVAAEFFYQPCERWYESRIYPCNEEVSVFTSDITLRKRLEKEHKEAIELATREQQQRIQEADEYRRKQAEFIDTLCHELRNPLNGIYVSILLFEGYLKDLSEALSTVPADLLKADQAFIELKENAIAIEQCAKQQKVIVDDVLDLSKLDSEKVELNPMPFQVITVLQSIEKMFHSQLQQKKLTLIIDPIDEALAVNADFHRLTQIITNLISNAIKFTTEGHICVTVWLEAMTETEAYLNITVSDTGIGMTLEEQTRLFNRFAQASRRTAAEYGGSGLGLVISKKLAEAMGGAIDVISQEGKGSRFHFKIRCAYLSEAEKAQIFQDQSSAINQHLTIGSNINNSDISILIADDDAVNRKVLGRVLENRGYHYQIVKNGQEAVDACKENKFDLIFMDIKMPHMGGLKATRHIHFQEGENAENWTPIIGLSGNVSQKQIQTALEAGMKDYLTKPYAPNDIYSMIEKHVLLNKKIDPGEISKSSSSIYEAGNLGLFVEQGFHGQNPTSNNNNQPNARL